MSRTHWRPAYIGIGSNLESPIEQVERGIEALTALPDSLLQLRSGLYRSKPLGPADQPDFINAVVAILTQLEPASLLAELHAIEQARGRKRDGERWGPRILDLDLLSFDGLVVDEAGLTLPHPGIAGRNFVLLPWRDIAPHYPVPGLATVAELAGQVPGKPHIERL